MIHPSDIIRSIEQTGEAFVITDPHGIIEYASPSIIRLSGYSPEELIGQSARIFKSDRNPPSLYDDMWETILAKQVWKGILKNRRKDGEVYLETMVITPVLDEKREIKWFIAVKCLADEAAISPNCIPGSLLMNHTSNSIQSLAYIPRMVNEFKVSLNSILGFSQILHEDLRSSLDEMQNEYFDILTQTSRRLLHTIDDTLLFARLNSGDCAVKMDSVPVAREMKAIISNILFLSNAKDIRFIKVIEDNGALVSVDRQYFEMILSNLLMNAIKFTEKGTITIGLETKSGDAIISIIDTGIGISDNFKPYIFAPFQQEELGYNQELEGSGLGLAITKRLTEFMGGKISFESKKHDGSSFIVRFPIVGWEKRLVTSGS